MTEIKKKVKTHDSISAIGKSHVAGKFIVDRTYLREQTKVAAMTFFAPILNAIDTAIPHQKKSGSLHRKRFSKV